MNGVYLKHFESTNVDVSFENDTVQTSRNVAILFHKNTKEKRQLNPAEHGQSRSLVCTKFQL